MNLEQSSANEPKLTNDDAYTAPESASVAVSINAERPEVVAPKIDSSTVVTTTTTLPEQSTTPPPTAEHISAPPTEALEASTTSSTATTTAPGKEQSTNAQANTEEPEVNVYTVEKIVGKRKRRGKVEYLIKWEGYPDTSNTWEKEEDVFCTELIQTYENGLLEKSKRKRKQPKDEEGDSENNKSGVDATGNTLHNSPKAKRPRKSAIADPKKKEETTELGEAEAEEVKVGFEFGDEIENILGIQKTKNGFLCAYVSWLGKDDCSYVPTQLIAVKSPQKLIAFYESHISFHDAPKL
jgi:chromobox protein 5